MAFNNAVHLRYKGKENIDWMLIGSERTYEPKASWGEEMLLWQVRGPGQPGRWESRQCIWHKDGQLAASAGPVEGNPHAATFCRTHYTE